MADWKMLTSIKKEQVLKKKERDGEFDNSLIIFFFQYSFFFYSFKNR